MVEEEIVDAVEPESKQQKVEHKQEKSDTLNASERMVSIKATTSAQTPFITGKKTSTESWNKSIGGLSKKRSLVGLVKVKKLQSDSGGSNDHKKDSTLNAEEKETDVGAEKSKESSNSLSLLGAYSDSESSD